MDEWLQKDYEKTIKRLNKENKQLHEKTERYEKVLTYLSDCTNYMDLDFVLDHVEDVAKEALKEKQ